MMIYAVLSHFDFVAKFTVKNMNKDFIKAVRGGRGGHRFVKVFHKFGYFLKDGFPKMVFTHYQGDSLFIVVC